ncbi:hypothetical protein SDRG_15281 [Saprolegnia diclina VS20]|uniref:Uncharacterized protein n=1 Tax=Saprolegnia diclina (strain VS20) TaxID=1156394 RepID=T0Q0U3_SAPDV|nr:hypothetical protein SDRG_15281 [Saprolegnia diclina VS20]EQC26950.1 hypothetical protein SDRG_15281 [Saprolegnia diclina VS20]|eukprot:XP_008619671.1 hypothetical protein SDRG_15281 [Saprolegnia diclina VS20]
MERRDLERYRYWQHKQDERLVKAIVTTTLDLDVGTSIANGADFWGCVHNDAVFSGWLPGDIRRIWQSELPDRWRAIQPELRRFTECYTSEQPNAGISEKQDVAIAALARYKSDPNNGTDFKFLDVWRWSQESAARMHEVAPRVCAIAPEIEGLVHSLQQCLLQPCSPLKRPREVVASTSPVKKLKVSEVDSPTSKRAIWKRRNELLETHNQLLRKVADAQTVLADQVAAVNAPPNERDAFLALQRRVIVARLQKQARELGAL